MIKAGTVYRLLPYGLPALVLDGHGHHLKSYSTLLLFYSLLLLSYIYILKYHHLETVGGDLLIG